jgi:hypothetical protein
MHVRGDGRSRAAPVSRSDDTEATRAGRSIGQVRDGRRGVSRVELKAAVANCLRRVLARGWGSAAPWAEATASQTVGAARRALRPLPGSGIAAFEQEALGVLDELGRPDADNTWFKLCANWGWPDPVHRSTCCESRWSGLGCNRVRLAHGAPAA